jgi:hypothetical protein
LRYMTGTEGIAFADNEAVVVEEDEPTFNE